MGPPHRDHPTNTLTCKDQRFFCKEDLQERFSRQDRPECYFRPLASLSPACADSKEYRRSRVVIPSFTLFLWLFSTVATSSWDDSERWPPPLLHPQVSRLFLSRYGIPDDMLLFVSTCIPFACVCADFMLIFLASLLCKPVLHPTPVSTCPPSVDSRARVVLFKPVPATHTLPQTTWCCSAPPTDWRCSAPPMP